MGFYTRDKVLYLPRKEKLIYDLLERTGEPNEFSYSPYKGMNSLIAGQMKGTYSNVDINTIKSGVYDIQFSLLKGSSEPPGINPLSDLESSDYEIRLENIHQDYIENFVTQQLVGIKVNKTRVTETIKQNNNISKPVFDMETNELHDTAFTVEVSHNPYEQFSIEDLKKKIPYLLNKLQYGSIKYGFSLLSFHIAIYLAKTPESPIPKPQEILLHPIYNVDSKGNITSAVDKTNANSGAAFIKTKNLILGIEPKNNPYYKAGLDLINITAQLGYDLGEEDPRDYDPAYISRLKRSYIMTNLEVLEDLSMSDNKIAALLDSDDFINKVNIEFNQPEIKQDKISHLVELADSVASRVLTMQHSLKFNLANSSELINTFLLDYNNVFNKTHSTKMLNDLYIDRDDYEKTVDDFYIGDDGVLRYSASRTPVLFNGVGFLNGFGTSPGLDDVVFIITINGLVVKVDNDPYTVTYTSISRVLELRNNNNQFATEKVVYYIC